MREIKFRAWQKDKKMMCEVSNIHFISNQVSLKEKENVTNTRPFDDVILMQYTGLKDKNGTEIYEGDIILTQPLRDKPFSPKAKSKRLRGIVKYNIKCGKNFIGEPDKIKYWGAEWDVEIINKKDYEKYHNFGWGLFFECEVIGNIYENPELLSEV